MDMDCAVMTVTTVKMNRLVAEEQSQRHLFQLNFAHKGHEVKKPFHCPMLREGIGTQENSELYPTQLFRGPSFSPSIIRL